MSQDVEDAIRDAERAFAAARTNEQRWEAMQRVVAKLRVMDMMLDPLYAAHVKYARAMASACPPERVPVAQIMVHEDAHGFRSKCVVVAQERRDTDKVQIVPLPPGLDVDDLEWVPRHTLRAHDEDEDH